MAYRGEDLDLRTPQTWNTAAGDLGSSSDYGLNGTRARTTPGGRTPPILVDDHVMACCNHAFDVAVAHRAGEVRIEHLLHAMTRIDAASAALEARNIRTAGLRRESATIIASEIPIALAAGQGRPHRSEDLETVLRRASAISYRRNGPANCDDVLDALLDMPSDAPGIALLARHGGRVARDRDTVFNRDVRDLGRDVLREPQPLPPLTRTSYASEPTDLGRDRGRVPVGTYYQAETAREPVRQPRLDVRTELVGTTTDGIQNARIDQIETALRALTAELANERGAVSGIVADLQRTIKLERDDTNRFRGGLHDRLQSLEQAVVTTKDSGDSMMLLDRLSGLERGFDHRLSEMARPWSVLSDRLQGIEQSLLSTRGGTSDDTLAQFERLERVLRDTASETVRTSASVLDRVKALERTVEIGASRGLDLTPLINRLDIIEEAVLGESSSPVDTKTDERLVGLEQALSAHRTSVQQAHQALSNDLRGLTAALAAQASGLERQTASMMAPLNERLGVFSTTLDSRMQAVAGLIDRQRTETAGPMVERVNAISSALDARAAEQQRGLAMLGERLAGLERQLLDSVKRATDVQNAHTAELREVHDALIKLNTNQHTLAGSIDQWRLDGVGDVSVIANRLDTIEKTSAKPVAMMEALTSSVDTLNRATVERYHRRNRFWYWLFGTDDWLTASWPSQVAAVEAERQTLRGTVPGVTVKITKTPA